MVYPELIKMNLAEGIPVDEDLEAISASAQRASDVISDLLALTRRSLYKMESLDLNGIINDFLNSAEFKSIRKLYPEVKPILKLSDDRLLFKGSESHLPKVITNLINNAFESMLEGGELRVCSSSIIIKD